MDDPLLISRTAEYALRAMAHLAAAGPPEQRARDVAAGTSIPVSYVSKVLRRLVSAGLLVSRRGHGGGFRLARAPERIRFLDVLAAADDPVEGDRCAFGRGPCNPRSPCSLHPAFTELKDRVHEWASRTTLADALERGPVRIRFLR